MVYQAVQFSTKRKVALKVMLEGPFAGSESKKRFEREIALVGSLRHPNIVPIFDSGVAQGRFFYATGATTQAEFDRPLRDGSCMYDQARDISSEQELKGTGCTESSTRWRRSWLPSLD